MFNASKIIILDNNAVTLFLFIDSQNKEHSFFQATL